MHYIRCPANCATVTIQYLTTLLFMHQLIQKENNLCIYFTYLTDAEAVESLGECTYYI